MLVACSTWLSNVHLVVVWSEDKVREYGMFEIEGDLIGRRNETRSESFQEKVDSLANLTTDDKCKMGMDLGVGFQVYTPYVNVGDSTKGMLIFKNTNLKRFVPSKFFTFIL